MVDNGIVVVENVYRLIEKEGVSRIEASNQGQKLDLALGFSHNIVFEIPSEVKVETRRNFSN